MWGSRKLASLYLKSHGEEPFQVKRIFLLQFTNKLFNLGHQYRKACNSEEKHAILM